MSVLELKKVTLGFVGANYDLPKLKGCVKVGMGPMPRIPPCVIYFRNGRRVLLSVGSWLPKSANENLGPLLVLVE